jgi:hypothetical protein
MSENPKAVAAREALKPTFHAMPPLVIEQLGKVMQHGADKYGRYNWRDEPVKATTYYDAINRHLQAWFAGQTFDNDSGFHHLAHVAGCCLVILDATDCNTLHDDRLPERR